MTLRILLLGGGDVGSAVAHRLYLHGADVVIADPEMPPHPRRGMAFTNAWFDGAATLEGVAAMLVADAHELAAHLLNIDAIAATSASPAVAAAALRPDALVDARMRKRAVPEDLRSLAPTVVGLGPGFVPGRNCSSAIETKWGECLGDVLRDEPSLALSGEPRLLGGAGRERFVYAEEAGLWRTKADIGGRVEQGALIGVLGQQPVLAPLSGLLRGLTHDGVPVNAGQKLVEIDPRTEPDAQGLGIRPSAIAYGVARSLDLPAGLEEAFFGFEGEFRSTLDCIPMSMRLKLDRCGVKLSLEHWRSLPRAIREVLLEVPADTTRRIGRMAQLLHRQGQRRGWPELQSPSTDMHVDLTTDAVPSRVAARFDASGQVPPLAECWSALSPLQRYALTRLASKRNDTSWRAALREFGFGSA